MLLCDVFTSSSLFFHPLFSLPLLTLVKHEYPRSVRSSTARGLATSRKSDVWGRSLANWPLGRDAEERATTSPSPRARFCIIWSGVGWVEGGVGVFC